MASTACARFLLSRNTPLLPLLARLPARSPTTGALRQQFQQLRHASKKAGKTAPKKKGPPPAAAIKTPPPLPQPLKYVSLAESLGNSGKERIILYACKNGLFVFGCYGLATGMVAWSVYTWNTNIANRVPGIPKWVVGATYASVTVMMLMAAVVAYYPTRIVQIIHAHPIRGTAHSSPGVSITLHKRPILPTLPMRKIHIPSSEMITLMEPLQPLHAPKAAESEIVDKRSAMTKIRHSVTGAPFKVFDFMRKALSTSGFVTMRVDDVGRFRLSKDGWVWERRGLDRLFKTNRR